MGPQASTAGKPTKEMQALSKSTNFSIEEIAALNARFQSIAENQFIKEQGFPKLLKLNNPYIAKRVFDAFNKDNNANGISFNNFTTGLSDFSPRASVEQRAGFVFRVYDIKKANAVSKDNLREIFNGILQSQKSIALPKPAIDKLIDDTFSAIAPSKNQITLPEFQAAAKANPQILSLISLSTDGLFI